MFKRTLITIVLLFIQGIFVSSCSSKEPSTNSSAQMKINKIRNQSQPGITNQSEHAQLSTNNLLKYCNPVITFEQLLGCYHLKQTGILNIAENYCFLPDSTFKNDKSMERASEYDINGNYIGSGKTTQQIWGKFILDGNLIKCTNVYFKDHTTGFKPTKCEDETYFAFFYQNKWNLISDGWLNGNLDSLQYVGSDIYNYLKTILRPDEPIESYMFTKIK